MTQRLNKPTQVANLPSFLKAAVEGNRFVELTLSELADTDILSTSSFRYDPRGEPLKSTQQLNVDWSKFENHTFFMPAEVKVNVAFDNIINKFPFDGTQAEIESFFDKQTGFEKWVYDQFPKNKGYLHFSGSWISIADNNAGIFPDLVRNPIDGSSVLNPQLSSFSIEGHIKPSLDTTMAETVLCQKYNSSVNHGWTLYLTPSSTNECNLNFVITSGSKDVHVSTHIQKDVWTHFVAEADRDTGPCTLRLFSDGELLDTSKTATYIGNMSIDLSPLTIGTGSAWYVTGTLTTPTSTFSGSLDDFRVFHSKRSAKAQQLYGHRGVYASPDLKAYYKFNEPGVQLTEQSASAVNAIIIDSSGNGLHSTINNYDVSQRISYNDVTDGPLTAENENLSPVLFPAHEDVVLLNQTLLNSASLYDEANPNIITNLIPNHYFLEGQSYDGFNSIAGNITNGYEENPNSPGQGQLGSTQVILTFLYTYAKFFDELKLYVDQFVNVNHANYANVDSVPSTFLYSLARQFGFDLPTLFNEASIPQYVSGDDINGVSTSLLSLREVQDQLMQRILVNLPKIIKSKGTLYSIKAFLRAAGIDPDTSVKIREYGGPSSQDISFSRERRFEQNVMAQFYTSSLAVTPFLSASRVEPGTPYPAGTFVNSSNFPPYGVSNNANDGLLTSGSWTWEAQYRWLPNLAKTSDWTPEQSLIRLVTTGSNTSLGGVIANLVATSGSSDAITLHLRPALTSSAPYHSVTLTIPSASIFDADVWSISFGCFSPSDCGSLYSSSYFIRAGKLNDDFVESYVTASYFYEGGVTATRNLNAVSNPSGTFLAIGKAQQVITGSTSSDIGHLYLNNTSDAPTASRVTDFLGRLSHARFWSKGLTEAEWREHVRNFRSAGVEEPLINYNFNKTSVGSFERLRLESFVKQDVRTTTNGNIMFVDTSLNGNHFTGSGFATNTNILIGELFAIDHLSPNYDEGSSAEKVRVRGYQDLKLLRDKPWSSLAPVYETPRAEKPTDDTRFVIEFSLIDALNRDIITMFSSFSSLEEAIGAPENMFSNEYPKLRRLSDVYFNRLSDKLNFKKFFEFYRWFDVSISSFIEQLIPRKTNFRGTNFTIESHMLERHKVEYFFNEIYLTQDERPQLNDVLLLQQIVGSAKKY